MRTSADKQPSPSSRRDSWPPLRRAIPLAILCLVAIVPPGALGEEPHVSITGGADAAGKNYVWVVTNEHTSPIESIEFPHYRGSLFFAPDGWDAKCTSLVNIGVPDVPGFCKASVVLPRQSIRKGQHRSFKLQMDARSGRRGRGNVAIRFADGSNMVVAGVEVPQQEGSSEKYVPIFGLVPMLLVAILVRRRRNRAATSSIAQ